MNILQEVSLIGKKLMLQEPFYGFFMLTLNKVVDPKVGTAGVSKKGINAQLAVAPDFWNKLDTPKKIGLFKHELMHLCFQHPLMRDRYNDHILFNVAADLEINQYIDESMLPEGGITFESLKIERIGNEFKGTDYYYKLLQEEKETNQNLKDMLDAIKGDLESNEGMGEHASHPGWEDFNNLSPEESKLIEAQIKHQAKEVARHCKSRGLVPSELGDFVDALFTIHERTVDWKQLFRRFIGGSKEVYTKKTRRKTSKRIHGNPGLKIKTKPHAIVYWDQSGSVGEDEHKRFFSEVKHIHKAGISFDIAPFNTSVFEPYKYKGENQYQVSGGGTSFTPISEHFNKFRHKYSFAVILTDGYAEKPPKFFKPVLWVITDSGVDVEESMSDWPGTKIKMQTK